MERGTDEIGFGFARFPSSVICRKQIGCWRKYGFFIEGWGDTMVRITRFLLPVLILVAAFGVNSADAQTVSFRNFSTFQDVVSGVDFFASTRQMVSPYENTATDAIAKLKHLLGEDLPRGAIFICSTLAQKDSLYEPVVMRQGYSWMLVITTQEARMEEQMERRRGQMGNMGDMGNMANIPDAIRQLMNDPDAIRQFMNDPDAINRLPENIRQLAGTVPREMMDNMDRQGGQQRVSGTLAKDIAFAVTQVMMSDENFQYRSSRVDDVGRSPLQDWMDIGIGAYVGGDKSSITYLRENLDMMFPIEDVLFMARPFVGTGLNGQQRGGPGGGEGFPGGGEGFFPGGGAGFPGGGQQGGGTAKSKQGGQISAKGKPSGGSPKGKPSGESQRTLPKDEQDRLLFDGQAISFFDYFLERFGIEKLRELIAFVRDKNESYEFVVKPEVLGSDASKIEATWLEWLNKQPLSEVRPKF